MKTRRVGSIGAALVALSVVMALGPEVQANSWWTFDSNQCSPLTEHEVTVMAPPAAMIMLDKSGSMRGGLWSQAKDAIDVVTADMTSSDPDTIEFGLGLFSGSSASIQTEAIPNANPTIMSILNSNSPGGSTPMSTAVRTMYQSDTVRGELDRDYQEVASYSNNSSVGTSCWSWSTSTITVPDSYSIDRMSMDLSLDTSLGMWGVEAELRHGGKTATLSGRWEVGPDEWTDRTVTDFEGYNTYGPWELRVKDCSWGSEIERWGLKFYERVQQRSTIGILITDGKPTDGWVDTVQEACNHRDVADLYVVGLSSGTDEKFNNVLAAAGGSGQCDGNLDPCDNPSNYSYYEDHCTGSYQTDNSTELANALSNIANEIACTYPLDVVGGGEVPSESEGCEDYDCVYVSLDGGTELSYGDGWTWASDSNRDTVKLTPTYCSQVQSGSVSVVETQVACLCSQDFGTSCNVFDPEDCECETGLWDCQYGTDICEPHSASSCPDSLVGEGDFCSVGQQSPPNPCYDEGSTFCDSSGNLQCSATPGNPQTEVCDGTDNNCNGIIDDVDWDGDMCHVTASDMFDQDAIDDETMRCNLGVAGCFNGQEGCVPLEPMPEVCNGIDDDCTGMIDNLHTSWDANWVDENNNPLTLSSDYESAACYERNVCSCPRGRGEIALSDDFDDHLSTWANHTLPAKPTCVCGEGLEP